MTFNPSYAELLGRELQRDRMREAERERLIRQVSGWNPSLAEKIMFIIRKHWSKFWTRFPGKKTYIPISREPKNSLSL